MARPNDYPRWRYLAMQATMWVLLACTVGVAALVDWDIRRSGAIGQTQDIVLQSVSLKVPAKWELSDEESSGSITTVRVIEPIRSPLRRLITISEADPSEAGPLTRPRGRRTEVIPFGASGTGYLSVSRTSLSMELGTEEGTEQLHISATGQIENGPIITITLDSLQMDDRPPVEQSKTLVKRIAASAKPALAEKGPQIGPR
jgi:hypothetical protein